MSLRHALLGLLAEGPQSGWDLTKCFEESLANVWTASHSQIYTELGKLEADGLAEVVEEGSRGRKDYAVTEAGRAEVVRWLVETEPARTVRNEPILRSFLLWLLEPEQARAHFEREAAAHADRLARYEALAAQPVWGSAPGRAFRVTLEAGLRTERALLEWARWAAQEYREQEE